MITSPTRLVDLSGVDGGNRTYNYVLDFLSGRKAVIKIGYIASNPIDLGGRGTPQGAVLSPLLFHIALAGLPAKLGVIPDLHHGLYADDITVWTGKGSVGEIQDHLQLIADVENEHAKSCGLSCSPQKSEILMVHRGRRQAPGIEIVLDGRTIRPYPYAHVKIFGMFFQADSRNTVLISRLKRTTE